MAGLPTTCCNGIINVLRLGWEHRQDVATKYLVKGNLKGYLISDVQNDNCIQQIAD